MTDWEHKARDLFSLLTKTEAERDDAIAHDYRKLMCMGVGDGSGSLFVYGDYESIKAAQSRVFAYEKSLVERAALKARVAEVTKERDEARRQWKNYESAASDVWDRLQFAESSLAASRRQVEGLKEDLERIHSAADEGSYRGCPHCLQVMGMIDDALSALDAPQPEAADE